METFLTMILPALALLSEALSLVPKIKANGIFQLIYNLIKWLVTKPDANLKNGG